MSDTTPACALCGTLQNLQLCKGCCLVYYCCKEHQNKHWCIHEWSCRSSPLAQSVPQPEANPFYAPVNGRQPQPMTVDPPQYPTSATSGGANEIESEDLCADINDLLANSSAYDLTHPVNISWSLLEAGNDIDLMSTGGIADKSAGDSGERAVQELPPPQTFLPEQASPSSSSAPSPQAVSPPAPPTMPTEHSMPPPVQHSHTSRNKDCQLTPNITTHHKSKEKELQLADYVIKSLHNYGLCVIDEFLGETICSQILGEVHELDRAGLMTAGQLCNPKNIEIATKIREDKIAWIEKGDLGHRNISFLIGRLDALIMQCNGRLQQYDINGRTKAMVACYPGNGSHYLRHVDNPNSDGRCITCIYYLNKDWDVSKHGGLLRIYPAKFHQKVADIEPIFDRVIFFWADYRNPHEVRPAMKTRYAITVWYFDAAERAKAKLLYSRKAEKQARKQQQQQQQQQHASSATAKSLAR